MRVSLTLHAIYTYFSHNEKLLCIFKVISFSYKYLKRSQLYHHSVVIRWKLATIMHRSETPFLHLSPDFELDEFKKLKEFQDSEEKPPFSSLLERIQRQVKELDTNEKLDETLHSPPGFPALKSTAKVEEDRKKHFNDLLEIQGKLLEQEKQKIIDMGIRAMDQVQRKFTEKALLMQYPHLKDKKEEEKVGIDEAANLLKDDCDSPPSYAQMAKVKPKKCKDLALQPVFIPPMCEEFKISDPCVPKDVHSHKKCHEVFIMQELLFSVKKLLLFTVIKKGYHAVYVLQRKSPFSQNRNSMVPYNRHAFIMHKHTSVPVSKVHEYWVKRGKKVSHLGIFRLNDDRQWVRLAVSSLIYHLY